MSAPRLVPGVSRSLILGALFLILAVAPLRALAESTPAPEADSYYGVYLKGAKIGYVTMHRTDAPAGGGRPATTRIESTMDIQFDVMGSAATVTNTTVSVTETKTGLPISQESRTDGAGRVTTVNATYTRDAVSYVADVQGSHKTGTLSLKPGERFLVDPSDSPMFRPEAGEDVKGKVFVAETLQLSDMDIKVVDKEPVAIGSQTVSAYKVVETSAAAGAMTSYINDAGDLLLAEVPLGMEIRKEPKEVALAPHADGARAPDLISITAIRPTGKPISSPRTAQTARYEISGGSRALPPTDDVQTTEYTKTADGTNPAAATPPAGGAATGDPAPARTAMVTVTARPLPRSGGTLFLTTQDAPQPLRPYLASTAYVASDSPTFHALAQKVLGGETDAAKAAAKIAAWVHARVKPDPGIVAFRSATDVYNDSRGVCRDYTVLFTAIARAAGLPTKQCVGVVYSDGAFFFHAWPEVWIGSPADAATAASAASHWVALEPTFGAPYADATHIKLAEGEITDVTTIASDMGKYRIQVDSIR